MRFRLSGRPWQRAEEPAAKTSHLVALTGLRPGALYRYQVLADDVPISPVYRLRAPRDPDDDDLSFAVVGDTAGGTVPAAIASRLSPAAVDLVLHAGDVVYPAGRAEDYDTEFFRPFAPMIASEPLMPVLGDHDIRTANGAPFFAAFDLPGNGITPQPRYYSFRQGAAEFFCLDVESSSYGAGSDQYRWLEQGLQQSTATWKFVTVFEPPFTSENSNIVERLILSPLFEQYGVDIVFSGHEHLYERTWPIRLFGPAGSEVTYVVEGGGGASLSSYSQQSFSAFVSAVYGYVTVRISDGGLLLEAHRTDGAVIDSFSLRKGPPPDAADSP